MTGHIDPYASELAAEIRARCAQVPPAEPTVGAPETVAVIDIAAHLGVLSLRGDERAREVARMLADDAGVGRGLESVLGASTESLLQAVAGLVVVLRDHCDDLRHAVAFADDPAAAAGRRERAIAGIAARETLARLHAAARCLSLDATADRLGEAASRHDEALEGEGLDLQGLQPVRSRLAEELGAAAMRHWWLTAAPDGDAAEDLDAEPTELPEAVATWLRSRLVHGPDGRRLRLSPDEAESLRDAAGFGPFAAWMGDRLTTAELQPQAQVRTSQVQLDQEPLSSRITRQVASGAQALAARLNLDRRWRLPVPADMQSWLESFVPVDTSAIAAVADDGRSRLQIVAGPEAPVGFQVGRVWVESGFGVIAWGSRLAMLVDEHSDLPGELRVGGWLLLPRADARSVRFGERDLARDDWRAGGVFVEQPPVDGHMVKVKVTAWDDSRDGGDRPEGHHVHLDRPGVVSRPSALEAAIDLLARGEAERCLDLLLALRDASPELPWADIDGLGQCAALRSGGDLRRPWS